MTSSVQGRPGTGSSPGRLRSCRDGRRPRPRPAASICCRTAGTLPPGSPATMIVRTASRGQVDPFRGGDLRQPQGVGGRTQQHLRPVVADRLEPGQAAQAAAGNRAAAQLAGRFKGRPETQERSEREGEVEAVPRPDPGRRKTCFQLSNIHCQLSAVSSQRSGAPRVALVWLKRQQRQRIGEIRAIGRVAAADPRRPPPCE